MPLPGPRNLLTDVPGVLVGHATDLRVDTGVTVIRTDGAWTASIDIRGGGPGGRESAALEPENMVGQLHALVFAGGSVFGLGAADAVAAALSRQEVGLHLKAGAPAIPIVPAAVLHDLGNGGDKHWGLEPPYRRLGFEALENAAADFALGSVGAGRGAMAGVLKGGLGSASLALDDGLVVAALVVANPIGSVYMPDGQTFWSWPWEIAGEFGGVRPTTVMDASDPMPELSRLDSMGRLQAGANTTLVAVACNARLTTAECKRVAIMAQDGIARAVRPAHLPFDGDTVFALASGALPLLDGPRRQVQIGCIGAAAADCVARAIARGVFEAGR
ncbi:P1 family peptidase [Pseudomonas gingeri]|uniref:P1 family peptidase n=1 Tax=Pseudomonas gingeri TaxID=117681 RepID=A0A7Y8CJU5_9PSED|nr:P1 family peptidase [Pseudomonas gingeri]NWA01032.1 P1 family peptidase [Pseudomonas gingeri]NWA14057.1 P1 family peptidase [Pseudomonas gingeri]NWA56557.1 P1 family peptidase [Pseudomonas gingeri]NWA95051.1 P1 family peptidase [Pseudomonas gingeri]NWB05133.1 P1 family peptidase [Pseudomonas gingeri]